MYLTKIALALAISVLSGSNALSTDIETGRQSELDLSVLTSHQVPPHQAQFRLPPTFAIPSRTHYVPTPGDWFLGTWYFTYSSYTEYQAWRNIQWTLSPTATNPFDDTLNDLTSFQWLNQSLGTAVWNIYGVDSRTVVNNITQRDAYDFKPTGPLTFANNTYEVLGWGYDSASIPWAALYETPAAGFTQGWLDIVSRSDKGPSKVTLDIILRAVTALGNKELNVLVPAIKKLVQDGGRNGEKFPTCDAECETNDVNPFGFS